MKFSRIIGKIDPAVIEAAEKKLSVVFLELASKPNVKIFGSQIGGDPLLFSLIFPMQHVATCNIPTAATDGKRYYWNPYFVNSLDLCGVRLTCGHESTHAIYSHPSRRGHRHPKLWNIAIDYLANHFVMADLKHRGFDPHTYFVKHLGNYLTLPQTLEMFANPFAFAMKHGLVFKHVLKETSSKETVLPAPDEERELTEAEKKKVEEELTDIKFFYADANLTDDLLRPEKIYDMLLKVVPRDPKTGELGIYYPPGEEDGPGYDVFGLGDLLDNHIDATETPEKMAKKLSDAIQNAKAMGGAGNIPEALEREIGLLTEPKIRWTDFIRTRLMKARNGNSKNDWSRFRSRPLMGGLMVPKKKGYVANFGVFLDVSGSMTKDDMALGLSQLMSLDERSEGQLCFFDAVPHWDKIIKLRHMKKEELQYIKPIGGGGTCVAPLFDEYEKYFGKNCSFLIVLTDGHLSDQDIAAMKEPSNCPVYWVITSDITSFTTPFGKVLSVRD